MEHLIEYVLPIDYYTTMKTIKDDNSILQKLIQICFPKLAKHMEEIFFDMEILAFPWLVSLFTRPKLSESVSISFQFFSYFKMGR